MFARMPAVCFTVHAFFARVTVYGGPHRSCPGRAPSQIDVAAVLLGRTYGIGERLVLRQRLGQRQVRSCPGRAPHQLDVAVVKLIDRGCGIGERRVRRQHRLSIGIGLGLEGATGAGPVVHGCGSGRRRGGCPTCERRRLGSPAPRGLVTSDCTGDHHLGPFGVHALPHPVPYLRPLRCPSCWWRRLGTSSSRVTGGGRCCSANAC